jgi:SSS family solute:Na+ symporter
MIFAKPGPNSSPHEINNYLTIPGLLSYVAGIWIVNLNYWGCNQYITQRALGAKASFSPASSNSSCP